MALSFKLVRERSRVRVEPEDAGAHLEITYGLDEGLPAGIRKFLVPRLRSALEARGQKLLAVDLFDEFVRLHLPRDSSPQPVESALREAAEAALQEASSPEAPAADAEEHLRRYLHQSTL